MMSIMVGCQDPPLSSIEKADFALKSAAAAGAKSYAQPLYLKAEEFLRIGQLEIARQKGRLAPLRDYDKADSLLNLAFITADQARSEARGKISDLRSKTNSELRNLQDELAVWKEALNGPRRGLSGGQNGSKPDLARKRGDRLAASEDNKPA